MPVHETSLRREPIMARRSAASLVSAIVIVIAGVIGHAGGWWTITIRDLPEYVVAGKRFQLTFMARVHGVSPLEQLDQEVVATSGADSARGKAAPARRIGEYTVSLVLPRPGSWTITFDELALPPVTAIAAGSPAPAPLSPSAVGARLFVSKGCIACHTNRNVRPDNEGSVGPDLTGKRFEEAYLKRFLADPQRARGRRSSPEYGEMPNLELTKREIAALVALINREQDP
jgi:mono/diheme cytochrome c family protein